MSKRKIVVFTAPSGAGKTTLARRILAEFPQLRYAVSATTRPPRQTERHGHDYFFVTALEFQTMIEKGALFEYEEVYLDYSMEPCDLNWKDPGILCF